MKRRVFVAALTPGIAALSGGVAWKTQQQGRLITEPNETWLRDLTGQHKQFFDVSAPLDGAALRRVANFLDAYRDAYGLSDVQVNAVFGAHGDGLAFVLNDSMWARFELGVRYSIGDPSTQKPARRNVYNDSGSSTSGRITVSSLQKRGVRFIACQKSITRLAREFAASEKTTEAELTATIERGLLVGVTPVPAMVVAANRAQEQGLAYVFVG
ncbi:MAG: hypothetical protein WD873_06960 [Candidatus Hydrogenedentales bacterium]